MIRSILPGATRSTLRATSSASRTSAASTSRRALATLSSPSSRTSLSASSSRYTLPLHPSSSIRTFHTTQPRPSTTLLRKPSSPEEPEVYRDGPPTIIATDRAISQLRRVAERENNPSLALRVAVEPGGCHGYQYKMEITEEIEEDDFQFEVSPGVSILVDSVSLALVRGSTIDYVTELIGSQFSIRDNPQAKGAGCGCGVSWEPAI